jgi:hypothetical protein
VFTADCIGVHTDSREIHFVHQALDTFTTSINSNTARDSDIIRKFAWIDKFHASVESQMFRNCKGKFGVMTHYHSSVVHHKEHLPITNHLFLGSAEFWPIFLDDPKGGAPDLRLLVQHLSQFAGDSLLHVEQPKQLFVAIGHAMIGAQFLLTWGTYMSHMQYRLSPSHRRRVSASRHQHWEYFMAERWTEDGSYRR